VVLPTRTAHVLSFAPTPTFALLAFLSATRESGVQNWVCSATHNSSALTGMVAMYLLMSLFHSIPWLRLIDRQHNLLHQ
jgi:hypothetical protein